MFTKYSQYLKNNTTTCIKLGAGILLVLALLFILAIISNFGLLLAKNTPFPVHMHSARQANYSNDPDFLEIAPVGLQLIFDAIRDDNPDEQSFALRLTHVNDNFFSVVASITPQETTNIPSSTPDGPTITEPGVSPTVSIPVTSTNTIPGPTGTGLPPTKTNIPGMPTNTESPEIPSSTPSQLSPTFTLTPPPTNTSTQPPPTNTTSPCGSLSLTSFSTVSKKVTTKINNGSPTVISISQINLTWPTENGILDKIFLGTSKIWDQTVPPPSVVINSGWTGTSRNIGGNTNSILKFTFTSQVASSGYNIEVRFTNGCSVYNTN